MCEAHHYAKGCANTAVYSHGLFRAGRHEPSGAALWMPPTKIAAQSVADDWRGVLSLSRLVVVPDAPPNAASFLLGRSMRLIESDGRYHTLLTYADTAQGHTGAIYLATNWTLVGRTKGDPVWKDVDGKQVSRKCAARTRRNDEMLALGYTKHPASPKLKYVKHLRLSSC